MKVWKCIGVFKCNCLDVCVGLKIQESAQKEYLAGGKFRKPETHEEFAYNLHVLLHAHGELGLVGLEQAYKNTKNVDQKCSLGEQDRDKRTRTQKMWSNNVDQKCRPKINKNVAWVSRIGTSVQKHKKCRPKMYENGGWASRI